LFSPQRRKERRDGFSCSLPLVLQKYRWIGRTAKNKRVRFLKKNLSFIYVANTVAPVMIITLLSWFFLFLGLSPENKKYLTLCVLCAFAVNKYILLKTL